MNEIIIIVSLLTFADNHDEWKYPIIIVCIPEFKCLPFSRKCWNNGSGQKMDLSNLEQKSNDIAKQGIAVQNVRCLQSRLRGKQGLTCWPNDLSKNETRVVHFFVHIHYYWRGIWQRGNASCICVCISDKVYVCICRRVSVINSCCTSFAFLSRVSFQPLPGLTAKTCLYFCVFSFVLLCFTLYMCFC